MAMSDPRHEELLSAYLDGELSAAERVQVEQLLAANPQARQLLDELRALSATLHALPQRKLGEDISPQVLRLAERRMLSEPIEAPSSAAAPRQSRLRNMLSRRALMWSGMAVAIAIVIAVFDHAPRERPHGAADRVAMAPRAAGEAGAPPRVPAPARLEEEVAAAKPAAEPDFKATKVKAATTPEQTPPQGPQIRAGDATDAVAKDASAVTKTAAEQRAPEIGGVGATHVGGTTLNASKLEIAKESPPQTSAPPMSALAQQTVPSSVSSTLNRSDDLGVVNSGSSYGGRGRGVGGQPMDRFGKSLLTSQLAPQGGGVLVVHCDISAEAARNETFKKLLTENQIIWEDAPAGKLSFAAGATGQQTQGDGGVAADTPAGAADLDLVYVEASPRQVQAALAQLAARPEGVLAVSVAPAPKSAAQPYERQRARRDGDVSQRNRVGRELQASGQAGAAGTLDRPQQPARKPAAADERERLQLGRARRINLAEANLGGESDAKSLLDDKAAQRETAARNLAQDALKRVEEKPAAPLSGLAAQGQPPAETPQSGKKAPTDETAAQAAPLCRVLFVLRVVNPLAPAAQPAAAQPAVQAEGEAGPAKP